MAGMEVYKMKFFNKAWCFCELNDDEIEQRLESYKNYIDEIYSKLPFTLKLMAKNLNLHDGKIIISRFIQQEKSLILKGIFGDLQTGYYFLTLKYSISKLDIEPLSSIFKDKQLEILSDEIEFLSENSFCHRIFFSTQQELSIPFKDIQIEIQNALPEDYKNSKCIFEFL